MTTTYARDFEAQSSQAGVKAPWLAELRRVAQEQFERTGFPTSRDEDWRFLNLAPVTGREFPLAPADVSGVHPDMVAPWRFAIPGVSTLVFVNGRYAPVLSSVTELPEGVTVRNLAGALAAGGDVIERHLGRYAESSTGGFTALNTALLKDGLFVHVAKAAASPPVHAIYLTDSRAEGAATHPRSLVVLEQGASAMVLESFVGLYEGTYLTNALTEAVIGDGANLVHAKLQHESERAYHVGTTHIRHGRDSRGQSFSVSFGAALCRNNLDVALDGPGVETEMLGLYLGRGTQEVDNHTSLLHAHPNCGSREIYKGILDGRSHGVFNGKIYVTPIAQQTDAKQTNRAILLSDQARFDTKPQLEIFADDVKCTHGATVGSIDANAVFYCRSRGIPEAQARKVLTYAFAAEVLELMPWADVRTRLETEVMRRLHVQVEG
ncbi:MAG: Fe-S cluster assembly protein SufD [Gemmatimonadales bacterium]|nr:MAG: Fe-S cluster assembly protein SufD [Gemmatimonadales bacterium]